MEYITLVCLLIFFTGITFDRFLKADFIQRKLREKTEKTEEEKEIQKAAFRDTIGFTVVTIILLISSILIYCLEVEPDIQKFNEMIKGG